MVKRRILAQGDRDGACLLYSLANGTQSLTGKKVSAAAWTRAVDALPFATGEFLTCRGSATLDNYPQCLELLATEFVARAGLGIVAAWMDELDSPARLQAQLTAEQVLVMAVENDAHWVAVVDISADQIFVACSWQALSGQPCEEKLSPNLNRYYNRCVSFAELRASDQGLRIAASGG